MSALADGARRYVPRTIPLKPGSKLPAVEKWTSWPCTPESVDRWWSRRPDSNVGFRCGNGLVVIDVDPRAGGDDLLADLEHEHGELPATLEVVTGGADGGRHLYFRGPVRLVQSYDLGVGLEVRSDGRQCVAPPSIHPDTGVAYAWRDGRAPGELPLAELPAWVHADRPVARPQADPAIWARLVTEGVDRGARNQEMTRLVGYLLRRYVDVDLVAAMAHIVNERWRSPLPAGEVDVIVDSIARAELQRRLMKEVRP